MLLASAGLAFVYGVDMQGILDWTQQKHVAEAVQHSLSGTGAEYMVALSSAAYFLERAARHLVGDRPFLEL